MAFKKIRETVEALRRTRPGPGIQPELRLHAVPRGSAKHHVGTELIFLFVVVLPLSLLIGKMLSQIFTAESSKAAAFFSTLTGIIIAYLIAELHGKMLGRVLSWIPVDKIKEKLSPFFGSKIEETIRAFKKSS